MGGLSGSSESDPSEGSRANGLCSSSWTLSSTEASSEGEVAGGGDGGLVVELVEEKDALCAGSVGVSRERKVGRLGVDLDWSPAGTVFPRLCGGMMLDEARDAFEPQVTIACFVVNAWPWALGPCVRVGGCNLVP